MTHQTVSVEKQSSFNPITAVLLILPLILLGSVIALFLSTGGGLDLAAPAPVEALTIERTILKPGSIDVMMRNTGPEEVTSPSLPA
jgi:hypothetical protein